jgi:hypothetical protein
LAVADLVVGFTGDGFHAMYFGRGTPFFLSGLEALKLSGEVIRFSSLFGYISPINYLVEEHFTPQLSYANLCPFQKPHICQIK